MVLKKDLKGKGPEEGQTQVAAEGELETTGQKRKLRSETNSQKKAKLETSISVDAGSPDNSTTHGEKNITTPISRPRRAVAGKASPTKAVSGDIPVPVTPDQTQGEAIRTSSNQGPSSSKEQTQRKLSYDSGAQAEIPESAIQVTTLARKSKGQKKSPNSSREIAETASTSSPSISTNRKDLPASTAVSDSKLSKKRGQKAPNASQDRTDETSTTIVVPSSSHSKKRERKSAIDKGTSNAEGPDNATPSSGRTTRGRRKAQEEQQSETAIVPEGAVEASSSSPKKGGRRKKLIDVNETPSEEVAESDAELVPLSTKKRGRPKKGAVPVVKQPKPVRERTKKAPNKSANGVKWTMDSTSSQKMATDLDRPELAPSTQRPRIWTQERGDLIAMLPEFAGPRCVNGLTWVMYETPMLLLDDSNSIMKIDWRDKNAHTFDLVTTRSFTCPVPSEERALDGSSQGYQDALYTINDEVKNEMDVHVDHPSTTVERNTTPSVPRIDITDDDSANKPLHPNIPGMVTNETYSPAENERSTVEGQKEGVPTYRVITPSYTPAQDPFVKKEETLYRFDNVPTIDTEATADRILDDASRLYGLQITTGMPAQDADAMDIIHSPESPTAPSLPPVPNVVPHSTSNISALEVQPPQDFSTSTPPPISEPAAPMLQDKFASYIPSPIPDELAAIVDAYVAGTPLTLLISNDRLETDWSLALPDEFGFIMMGYFKILGIQEERLAQEDNLPEKKPNLESLLTGRVRWRITLQWTKGGEKYISPNSEAETLRRPWWSPAPPNSDVPETPEPPASPDPNSQQELEAEARTTEKYRIARREHPNWEFRHYDYDNTYHGLVPKHLMAPFGADHFDDFFPSGWFCTHCGRLNFQDTMRHRRCKSSFCKDLPPPTKSYSIDLLYLRDPHDRHVVFLPSNSHPSYILSRREDFPSGLITFSYGTCEAQNSLIKHIFTSNLSEHQEEATKLLKDVQPNVELVRTTDLSDPYFSYSTKGKKLQGDLKSLEAQWLGVPECVNTCRKFMSKRLLDFAYPNPGELSIGLLTIVSWITAGIKTIPVPVNAKKHPVSVLCMGCEVVLNITLPASVTVNKPGAGVEEAGEHRLAIMNEDNGEEVEMADPSLGWVADDPETMALLQEQNLTSSPRKNQPKLKAGKKISKDTFVLTLVHGDMAVFFGESFECSIKRGGTSLLVIATQN